jgi:hypothetical protein
LVNQEVLAVIKVLKEKAPNEGAFLIMFSIVG